LGTEDPIRDLDPQGDEWRWPEDAGEVHDEGRIIGGTLWDLRASLIEKYGVALGVAKTDQIWLDGIRRSIDIPSWYVEALVTNDDDGDLQNGTPDICEINAAFAAHGLYQPLGAALDLSETTLADGSTELTLSFATGFDACPGTIDPSALLRWRPRAIENGPEFPTTELSMNEVGVGLLRAVIPAQADHTVTQYQVELDWGNGTAAPRPDNRADKWYEYFTGEVTPIWCSDFEGSPASEGWTAGGEWSFGPPEGGGGDPGEAFAGSGVTGVALSWPGTYAPWTESTLTSPMIDVSGHEVVRLQYRRWLNVEDGFYDRATISANGEPAWANAASQDDWGATVHHGDREWRFHDVDLTSMIAADGQLSLSFSMSSDGGLEFGGWTIDQLCVVAHEPAEPPVPPEPPACGDGIVQANEQCDDGNLANGDGCSSGCLFDYVPPEPEPEELGWDPDGRGCGCAAEPNSLTDRAGGGALALLGLLGLSGIGRRRRRRAHG
jgi:cysteine-rich repeat protein